MAHGTLERSTGWYSMGEIPATVSELVDLATGRGTAVALKWENSRVWLKPSGRSADGELTAICIGAGGGLCWSREWSTERARRFVSETHDHLGDRLKLQRGQAEAILPGRYNE